MFISLYLYSIYTVFYVLVDRQVGREGERENSNKTVLPTSSKIIDTAQQPFNRQKSSNIIIIYYSWNGGRAEKVVLPITDSVSFTK